MKVILDLKIIGQNIVNIRTSKGLSRPSIAEKSKLSDRAYADIERGTSCPSLKTFLDICEALDVTPNDILVDNDGENPKSQEALIKAIQSLYIKDQDALSELISKIPGKK